MPNRDGRWNKVCPFRNDFTPLHCDITPRLSYRLIGQKNTEIHHTFGSMCRNMCVLCNLYGHGKNKYTHAHLWFPPLFLALNHYDIETWDPSILTHNLWLIFMGMKQKNFFFFLKKKIQNGRLKKGSFFNSVNSQFFFVKI